MPRMSYARGVLLTALAALAFITLLITSPSVGAQAGAQGGGRAGGQAAAQAPAQPTRTVQDGVFSDAQATRGQALYAQRCAGCHGPALAGASAPALTGDLFTNKFRMEPLSALFIQIRYAMPPVPVAPAPAGPGPAGQTPAGGNNAAAAPASPQLTNEQAADLVAHILKSNGFPAGKADFPAADAINSQIGWPAGRGVGAGSAPASTWYAPTGNLAQLMRGVFFHNSNLIFSIQEMEAKDLPPKPPDSRPDGLTTFDWGLMIYTGWRAVEQSATAIADASSLMMLPGLRCENGRAAPVTEPDWIRFTDRMVSVARRTYRLAQTKNKDAVAEFTLDLSNACNACHGTYRDVGGRGRGGAGNTAGRCMHR
jgi:cbb3-type cytochrome c oxidase subunit III